MFGRLYAVEDLRDRIAALAQELDLSEFLDRPTGKLSAGQKTRVALAKALINSPEVLLLDEPTASLDPDTADWVRSHLERFRAERSATVLLASHNMAEVERLCERVIIMKRGKHRGRRHAAAPAGALRPRNARGGVPRRRARPRRSGARGRAMSAHSTSAFALAPHRVGAMVLRYLYLLRSSWTRLVELIYWPAVQLFVWGFLQLYIAQNSGFFARAGGMFIGAVLMWDILFRGQLGFSVSFLEEMWSRNLGNLMISPLRPIEFVCALMIMSIVRLAIGMVPVTFLAIAFFGFNVYSLGFALAAFFLNLILTSWAVGIVVSGVLLRNGMGAESLAWTLMFVLMPLTCVYYPVSVLPDWLQCDRLGAAADLCVRGHARAGPGAGLPRRPDDRGVRAQRRLFRSCGRRVPGACSRARAGRARCCRPANRTDRRCASSWQLCCGAKATCPRRCISRRVTGYRQATWVMLTV